MKTMQELEAELLKAKKEAARERDELKITRLKKAEELEIENGKKRKELESERLRKFKELESEELTKAKELEDEALRKQQALCQKIADRKTFLEQLTAQLSENLDACDIADLKETDLSKEEQLKTAVDLLKLAIQLKKPDAIVALISICEALNGGGQPLPFYTVNSDSKAIPLYPVVYGENSPQPVFSPWELIIASIASGDPKIFQLVYSTLATEKDKPLTLAWHLYEGREERHNPRDKKSLDVYTAVLTTTNPEDRPRIQEAVEKTLDEQLRDPNIDMVIKFNNSSSEVKKIFKENIAFYKEWILRWAISENDITSFISALKNLNDRELRSYSIMKKVAFFIKQERTDFLEHLLTHYYKDEQKRSEVICSFNNTREINREVSGSFSMLAAAAQSQNPKIVSLALKFYPSNVAKLKAMIAPQKGISSDIDSDDDYDKITHHFSALAIAASQLDVKVLQALVQGFSPKEKRAVLKELASYTPDYLSDISRTFLGKIGLENIEPFERQLSYERNLNDYHRSTYVCSQKAHDEKEESIKQRWEQGLKERREKKEAFKIFLITLYKESREQISEEFFSSSFCFFQTARKIKISAAQKIIALKPHNTMTDEERDASKAGLLGKIMHRFN